MVFELIAGLALIFIVFAILATTAIVYRDARRSETEYPPLLWAALTLITGLGGVILYVLVEKLHLLSRHESQ